MLTCLRETDTRGGFNKFTLKKKYIYTYYRYHRFFYEKVNMKDLILKYTDRIAVFKIGLEKSHDIPSSDRGSGHVWERQ